MPFNLAQFVVQQAVLEIRYAQAFTLWDRTGAIWHQVQRKYPEAKAKVTQPNQIIVRIADRIEGQLAIDRAHAAVFYPSSDLKSLKEVANVFLSATISQLEIADLSRIGLRVFYEQTFKERQAAADAVIGNVRLPKASGKNFNVEGRLLDPEVALRWEGPATGCLVRVQALEQTLDIDIPPEFAEEGATLHRQRARVLIDVDYYAHASTPATRFDPSNLIESWAHVMRRDVPGFLQNG
jgi:hypothetical protein